MQKPLENLWTIFEISNTPHRIWGDRWNSLCLLKNWFLVVRKNKFAHCFLRFDVWYPFKDQNSKGQFAKWVDTKLQVFIIFIKNLRPQYTIFEARFGRLKFGYGDIENTSMFKKNLWKSDPTPFLNCNLFYLHTHTYIFKVSSIS